MSQILKAMIITACIVLTSEAIFAFLNYYPLVGAILFTGLGTAMLFSVVYDLVKKDSNVSK